MDDLTRTVLEDVACWKRQGVLPSHCPRCGASEAEHCLCQPATYSLRDHASDPEAFDRATGVRLRVLTMPPDSTDPDAPVVQPPCAADLMVCRCVQCAHERAQVLKRGPVKVRQPWEARPSRRRAA